MGYDYVFEGVFVEVRGEIFFLTQIHRLEKLSTAEGS